MLDDLITTLKELIRELMTELARSTRSQVVLGGWVEAMSKLLARYSTAAYMAGQDSSSLTPQAKAKIAKAVGEQVNYLENFALEIQEGAEWQRGWEARAESYANSVGQSYWQGKTKMLPLPALPKDGTSQCLGNCECAWQVKKLEGPGNYDCTWKLGAKEQGGNACQTCEQRAEEWNPLRIRGGRVELD